MPRDSNGIYTLPPGYLAVTGQTILASQHNPPLEDIASSMTNSLPRNGSAPMTSNLPMGGFRITGMADGVGPQDAATKAQTDTASPIGSVIDFAGATAPEGWLLCFGQAVSRTTYAALFSAIGTTYGAGDSSTTFNVPDCRGRTSAGKDNMGGTAANRLTGQSGGVFGGTLGTAGGTEAHTLTAAQAPSHAHTVTVSGTTSPSGDHSHGTLGTGFAAGGAAGVTSGSSALVGGTAPAGNHAHSVTSTGVTDVRGSDQAHNNVQPTIIFNKIIRAD